MSKFSHATPPPLTMPGLKQYLPKLKISRAKSWLCKTGNPLIQVLELYFGLRDPEKVADKAKWSLN